ncbi:MAG: hypothetical protein K6T75_03930 [Acetobacteraceae bacterium]|nr:hypothetical protein [Acetobacteraceae bacterium]
MVRADTLHLQIPFLLSRGRTDEAAASVSGIWRYETGATSPGFRDRYIHALQLNVMADPEQGEETLWFLGQALMRFFDRLCLPGLLVDGGPWRHYLDRRFFTVHAVPGPRLTITSTLFSLGPVFRRFFGTDRWLFDVGLTEKVLAVMAMIQDTKGLRLPSGLAPVHVALMPRRGGGGGTGVPAAGVVAWA